MTLIRFKRLQKRKDEPVVSIRGGRFSFNAHFAELAELRGKRAVLYSVDDERREIGFEFLTEREEDDAYTLEHRGGMGQFRCSALELIRTKDSESEAQLGNPLTICGASRLLSLASSGPFA